MTGFVCERCNYRFESKADKKAARCPYCGEIGLIEEPSAEELLKEELF